MPRSEKTKALVGDGDEIIVIDDSVEANEHQDGQGESDVSRPGAPQPILPPDFEFPEKDD